MSRRQDSSPRTSALAALALLVAQTGSALADPQSPSNSADGDSRIDFQYGVDYNGLDVTRPEKVYAEMRLEDRTSGTTKSVDAQTLRRCDLAGAGRPPGPCSAPSRRPNATGRDIGSRPPR